ncbi:MAG: class I SAM-dependent methyltransferase [Myxococcales bacterium]|nr:class I SAM-dependent methyltransferase [Myxococcales bacterium]
MGLWTDMTALYHLLVTPSVTATTHEERMERFYAPQIPTYDALRERMLQGRPRLLQAAGLHDGGVWIDYGTGTGLNLEGAAEQIPRLKKVYAVDISSSMLQASARRIARHGWRNVELVHADASTWEPPCPADSVTFFYSLTMMPQWQAALHRAHAALRRGGTLAAADFHLCDAHSAFTRWFWRTGLARDHVRPDPAMVARLAELAPGELFEGWAKIPYLPVMRAPYYVFAGRRAAEPA